MNTKFSEDIVPLSDLKTNPGRVVKHVSESQRPVLLTSHGRSIAVVQSLSDYEKAAEEISFMRAVCGRLESRYQYSASIVFNNFPWPCEFTDKQKEAIEQAAQGVLDARAAHPESSLADLYDPIAMPPDLRHAHQALDKAVDAAYGKKGFASDAERLAFLFELYHQNTSLLPGPEKNKKGKRKKTTDKKNQCRTVEAQKNIRA